MATKYGLEAPIDELKKKITDYSVYDAIDILAFARIGRCKTGEPNQFTFVHRRFFEYFAMQGFEQKGECKPMDIKSTHCMIDRQ